MTTREPSRTGEAPAGDVGEEIQIAVAARKELGPELEDPLVRSFLEKIDREIDRRIAVGIEARSRALARRARPGWSVVLSAVVAVTSLMAAVPATLAVVAAGTGLVGVAIVWLTILIINLLVLVRR